MKEQMRMLSLNAEVVTLDVKQDPTLYYLQKLYITYKYNFKIGWQEKYIIASLNFRMLATRVATNILGKVDFWKGI
jgi:hypothetical protein